MIQTRTARNGRDDRRVYQVESLDALPTCCVEGCDEDAAFRLPRTAGIVSPPLRCDDLCAGHYAKLIERRPHLRGRVLTTNEYERWRRENP